MKYESEIKAQQQREKEKKAAFAASLSEVIDAKQDQISFEAALEEAQEEGLVWFSVLCVNALFTSDLFL